MLDFPANPSIGDLFTGGGSTWRWDGTKWTADGLSGGPFLPIAGGDMVGPLGYEATGGTVVRSAQDRAAEVLYAEDYGVVPNAADNTAALQTFFAALQAFPTDVKGVLPSGVINFTTSITALNSKSNWSLVGSGIGATQLIYKGSDTTVDLLKITLCSYFSLEGFSLDSTTVMTAGTALHLDNCVHGFLSNITAATQAGNTHVGTDSNLHYNLWNGFWFDKIDFGTISNFEAFAQNDCVRLNGGVGSSGGKADLLMQFGKIANGYIGVHVGGAFGGLLLDNVDVIANWYNCVIDESLAAEANREIFLGVHAVFDSSGAVGTPTQAGPVNPGGGAVGDNILINDASGGFLVIKGWVATAGHNGSNIHVVNWAGTITIDGCLIPYASADGIRIDTVVPLVIVSSGTQLHHSNGYGINQTTPMNPVLGAPVFLLNTSGDISPTTKLELVTNNLARSFATTISAAGTTQGTATPITTSLALVTTVSAGSGVILPATLHGTKLEINNTDFGTTASLKVYPPVGWSIYGGGLNDAIVLPFNYRLVVVANVVLSQYFLDYIGPCDSQNLVRFVPGDDSSIQSGSASFAAFDATLHTNTGFGGRALLNIQNTGINNTAFGGYAGIGISTSDNNTFIGAASGYALGTSAVGSSNTALGALTGFNMTTAAGNTLIGFNAGNGLTTGSNNIFIGDGSGLFIGGPTESHVFRIGTSSGMLLRATGINTATPAFFLDWFAASTSYANDAAAAVGGVQVNQIYRNGSVMQIRVT